MLLILLSPERLDVYRGKRGETVVDVTLWGFKPHEQTSQEFERLKS